MIGARSPASLLLVIAGLAIWGLAFNVLYGAHAVGCELGWRLERVGPTTLQRVQLVALWAAHLALHIALIVWLHRRLGRTPPEPGGAGRFIAFLGLAVAWLGVVATLWTGAVVAFLTTCAP